MEKKKAPQAEGPCPGWVRARGLLSSGLQEEELGSPSTREEWKTR